MKIKYYLQIHFINLKIWIEIELERDLRLINVETRLL